jgi:hypothetical protein
LGESSLADWVAAIAAIGAFLAAILFGWLNLVRARKGPNSAPQWSARPTSTSRQRFEVVLAGAPAYDVEIVLDEWVRHTGDTEFEVFSVGQATSLIAMLGIDQADGWPSVQVRFATRPRVRWWFPPKRHTWKSSIPVL